MFELNRSTDESACSEKKVMRNMTVRVVEYSEKGEMRFDQMDYSKVINQCRKKIEGYK